MQLSDTMKKTLSAIAEHGGIAVAEGGGWWQGGDGVRLEFPVDDWRKSHAVGTRTIYALEDRGMLQRLWTGKPYYRDSREITDAGREAIA